MDWCVCCLDGVGGGKCFQFLQPIILSFPSHSIDKRPEATGHVKTMIFSWRASIILVISIFCVIAINDPNDLEVDLRSTHGLLNTTKAISQETLQKIISGAEAGNKGNLWKLGNFTFY